MFLFLDFEQGELLRSVYTKGLFTPNVSVNAIDDALKSNLDLTCSIHTKHQHQC